MMGTSSAIGRCSQRDLNYQLVTGYVYQYKQHIILSKPGILELSDCLFMCLNLVSCKAINYETGLCVAFNSSAIEHPEHLAVSEFPVFTMYAEKICLPTTSMKPCKTAWAFEMVPDAELEGFEEKKVIVRDVSECRTKCRDEENFSCRSANFNSVSGTCSLSSIDRHSSPSPPLFHESPGTSYLENTCVEKPAGLCDFKAVRGRILKTVDSVYQDIRDSKQCQALCTGNTNYQCNSFDYSMAGEKVCRLSHHSAATLSHVRQPFLEIQSATMYQVTACYNVSVSCTDQGMVATVRTSKMFSGKIYTKSRPHSCIVDVKNRMEFELSVGYNDVNCDVERSDEGHFLTDVILQHHDRIVTSTDIGLQVRCKYDMANTTIHQGMKMGVEMDHQAYAEETLVGAPNVSMRITGQDGGDVSSAKVGDPLALRFEILDKRSPYEIFVRELVAMDGLDTSEILLIDSVGCPTDSSIMQSLVTVGSAKILQANFDAFKFPTSQLVQFRALVTPCMPHCDPVRCSDSASSYGRKRREVTEEEVEDSEAVRNSTADSVVVANAVHIVDTFKIPDHGGHGDSPDGVCVCAGEHILTVCLVLALFLVCQCVLVLVCVRHTAMTRRDKGDHSAVFGWQAGSTSDTLR